MKTQPDLHRSKGFTLIELLVVMTLIATLAALCFTGISLAIKKVRKAEGETTAKALAAAITGFYSEYNRLPDLGRRSIQTHGDQGAKLLEILTGQEVAGADMQNPRRAVLFGGKEAKAGKGGLEYAGSSSTPTALWDPFGQPYTVALNADLEDSFQFEFGGTQTVRGLQAVVFSLGGDGQAGTSDDITSWR